MKLITKKLGGSKTEELDKNNCAAQLQETRQTEECKSRLIPSNILRCEIQYTCITIIRNFTLLLIMKYNQIEKEKKLKNKESLSSNKLSTALI